MCHDIGDMFQRSTGGASGTRRETKEKIQRPLISIFFLPFSSPIFFWGRCNGGVALA